MSKALMATITTGSHKKPNYHNGILIDHEDAKVLAFYIPKSGNTFNLDASVFLHVAADKAGAYPIMIYKKRSIPAITTEFSHIPDCKGFWSASSYEIPEDTLIQLYISVNTKRGVLHHSYKAVKFLWFSSELEFQDMYIHLPPNEAFFVNTTQVSGKFKVLGDKNLSHLGVQNNIYGANPYDHSIDEAIFSFNNAKLHTDTLPMTYMYDNKKVIRNTGVYSSINEVL